MSAAEFESNADAIDEAMRAVKIEDQRQPSHIKSVSS